MNRLLCGNGLFDEVSPKKPRLSNHKLLNGKCFCGPHNTSQLENALSDLFTHLRQELVSLDSRITQAELLKRDESDRDSSYLVKITSIRGKLFRKYGFTLPDASRCLYPEEAFYLSQCGSLQVYDGGLPLSLQQLCSTIFRNGSEFATYLAYARLVRQGFVLRRRKTFGSADQSLEEGKEPRNISLPANISSEESLVELDSDTISEESLIAFPDNRSHHFPDLTEPLAPTGSSRFHGFDLEKYSSLIIFDVFDDRMGNFKKSMSAKPLFVLIVFSANDVVNFLPDELFRRRFAIPPETGVLVAVVNDVVDIASILMF
ncbi:hypothetical protein Aperf_G00000072400 [Anoplocephala perfoliata]